MPIAAALPSRNAIAASVLFAEVMALSTAKLRRSILMGIGQGEFCGDVGAQSTGEATSRPSVTGIFEFRRRPHVVSCRMLIIFLLILEYQLGHAYLPNFTDIAFCRRPANGHYVHIWSKTINHHVFPTNHFLTLVKEKLLVLLSMSRATLWSAIPDHPL